MPKSLTEIGQILSGHWKKKIESAKPDNNNKRTIERIVSTFVLWLCALYTTKRIVNHFCAARIYVEAIACEYSYAIRYKKHLAIFAKAWLGSLFNSILSLKLVVFSLLFILFENSLTQ